jgi:hypothetical protein
MQKEDGSSGISCEEETPEISQKVSYAAADMDKRTRYDEDATGDSRAADPL